MVACEQDAHAARIAQDRAPILSSRTRMVAALARSSSMARKAAARSRRISVRASTTNNSPRTEKIQLRFLDPVSAPPRWQYKWSYSSTGSPRRS